MVSSKKKNKGKSSQFREKATLAEDTSLPTGWDIDTYNRLKYDEERKGTAREVAYENSKAMKRYEREIAGKRAEDSAFLARQAQRQIRKLKEDMKYVDVDPQPGQYTIVGRVDFSDPSGRQVNDNGYYLFNIGGALIKKEPLAPFYVHKPQIQAVFTEPNRAQRRQGVQTIEPRYNHLLEDHGPIFSKHGSWAVEFDMLRPPPESAGSLGFKHFESLPRPDTIEVRLEPNADYSVTYLWQKSRVDRNKLQHALNGNVEPPRTNAQSSNNTVKKCNKCGSDKHLSRACKDKSAKGGGKGGASSADQALKGANRDYDARKKADEDVRREKAKDEVAKPKPHEMEVPHFRLQKEFFIRDTKPINSSWWVYVLVLWKLLLPTIIIIVAADLLVWPLFCLYVGYAITHFYSMIGGSITAGFLFWAENCVMGLIVYYGYLLLAILRWRSKTDRLIKIRPLDTPEKIRELDYRPSDMKHGPREFTEDLCRVSEDELFYAEWESLGITMHYGTTTVREYKVSGSAFAMLASAITSRKTRAENSDGVRRILCKFSKVDWDANQIIEYNLVENTAMLLDHWKHYVDETPLRVDKLQDRFNVVHYDDFDDWCPMFMRGIKNKLITFTVLVLIFFFICQWAYWIGTVAAVGFRSAAAAPAFFNVVLAKAFASHSTVTTPEFNIPPMGVYGYRTGESFSRDMKNNDISPDKNIDVQMFPPTFQDRELMNIFTPFAIPGIAMPVADRKDPLTTVAGLIHRGGGLTPKPLQTWMRDKKTISEEVCAAYFPVLNDSEVLTHAEVLDKLPYTVPRKVILAAQHRDRPGNYSRYTKNRETGFFGKDEPYSEPKHLRGIHAMGDGLWDADVLGAMGAWVKTVEQYVYTIPPCAKHLDPRGVVDKLLGLGPGSKTVSDYSSYEASFSRSVKEVAQFNLYDYMSQGLGHRHQLRGYYRWLLGSVNRVRNKFFNANISDIKCSGDFDTALSNWYDNVISWLTVFSVKHDVHWSDSINWFLCEGDDNITDDHGYTFEPSDFANLGLKAKIETGLAVEEAGFCQKFVNPDSGNLVGDVIRFLGRRQYFSMQYLGSNVYTKMSLLRAAAMSTLATTPNAPGISEWAWKVMQLTQGTIVKQKHLNAMQAYGAVIPKSFTEPKILFSDRLTVSSVFGFTLEQQGVLTECIAKWTFGPLVLPLAWFPEEWQEFHTTYSGCPGEILDESEPDAMKRTTDWLLPVLGTPKTSGNNAL